MSRSFFEHRSDNHWIRSRNYASTETWLWSQWRSSKRERKVPSRADRGCVDQGDDCLEQSSQRGWIIGVAIGGVLVIIGVMGIFYVLRRQCVNRRAKNETSTHVQDGTVDSVGSYRTGGTALSQKTSQTGNSFLPWWMCEIRSMCVQ